MYAYFESAKIRIIFHYTEKCAESDSGPLRHTAAVPYAAFRACRIATPAPFQGATNGLCAALRPPLARAGQHPAGPRPPLWPLLHRLVYRSLSAVVRCYSNNSP